MIWGVVGLPIGLSSATFDKALRKVYDDRVLLGVIRNESKCFG